LCAFEARLAYRHRNPIGERQTEETPAGGECCPYCCPACSTDFLSASIVRGNVLLKGIGDGYMIFLGVAVIRARFRKKIVDAVVYVVARRDAAVEGAGLSSGSLLRGKKSFGAPVAIAVMAAIFSERSYVEYCSPSISPSRLLRDVAVCNAHKLKLRFHPMASHKFQGCPSGYRTFRKYCPPSSYRRRQMSWDTRPRSN